MGKVRSTLGTVEASEQGSAIAEAAKQFHITPAQRKKIVVTRLEIKEADKKR